MLNGSRYPLDAKSNTWKLQDAKARFSEVVRRAKAGEPQHITVHGNEAVVIVDPHQFEVRRKEKARGDKTMAGFIERSRKYFLDVDVEFDRSVYMDFPARRLSKRLKRR
jgi:antitoxin Phd